MLLLNKMNQQNDTAFKDLAQLLDLAHLNVIRLLGKSSWVQILVE